MKNRSFCFTGLYFTFLHLILGTWALSYCLFQIWCFLEFLFSIFVISFLLAIFSKYSSFRILFLSLTFFTVSQAFYTSLERHMYRFSTLSSFRHQLLIIHHSLNRSSLILSIQLPSKYFYSSFLSQISNCFCISGSIS